MNSNIVGDSYIVHSDDKRSSTDRKDWPPMVNVFHDNGFLCEICGVECLPHEYYLDDDGRHPCCTDCQNEEVEECQ